MTLASRCLVLIALAATVDAAAQTPDVIVTERPSFTDSALVVGAKMVQIESGGFYRTDTVLDSTDSALSAPNVLLRFGVTDRLEFRVGAQGVVRETGPRDDGRSDLSGSDTQVSVKYQLTRQSGAGLDVAVLPYASVPTGGAASSRNIDPGVNLIWARSWGDTSLGGTFNWSSPSQGDGERARLLDTSLVLGNRFRGVWGTFLEGVMTRIDDSDLPSTWHINTGVTRVFGNNLQADLRVGRGLNDAATDWTFGAGLSYRFRR